MKNSKPKARSRPEPIAIVGASALFPGSVDRQRFWRNIVAGRDFISDVPPSHWLPEDYFDADPKAEGKVYTQRGAFLPEVPFNPMEFGVPPKNLPSTDTVQLLSLIVAKSLIEETRSLASGKVDRKDVGVILGVAAGTELIGQMVSKIQRPNWLEALRRTGVPEAKAQEICDAIRETYPDWNEATFPGLLGNVVAGRIANRFDLGGLNCVTDAACASSLSAISMAVDELRLGRTDLVLTGGADALNDIFMFMCFSKTPAISPSGDCRPFSDDADGTMMGEGLAFFALRRLSDAERDGDRIYGLITGVGSSSDGKSKSVYAPRSGGQALAIQRAWSDAQTRPELIELIEAHGTATGAGDAAECEGLRIAFSESGKSKDPWCALGSIKSQFGHTKSTAGAAGLFKTLMALDNKVFPPSINISTPNENLKLDESPLYLNSQLRPWIHEPDTPRQAGLSSFGFGGSNYHLVVEEYSQKNRKRIRQSPIHLLLASADTSDALLKSVSEIQARYANDSIGAAARNSQVAYDSRKQYRLAIIVEETGEIEKRIETVVHLIEKDPETPLHVAKQFHYESGKPSRQKIAFLFPGQGSQYVNMGCGLATEFDCSREVWDRLATRNENRSQALHQIVFPPPAFSDEVRIRQSEALKQTEWAQPALGLVSLSMLSVLEKLGLEAEAVAGHSYGELVALFAGGAIASEEDLVRFSFLRGERMASASDSQPGSMTAVMSDVKTVSKLLGQEFESLAIANSNSPQQTIVAGATDEIERFEARLSDEGALRFKRLEVATAFHSPIVAKATKQLEADLSDFTFRKPCLPVYSNTTAKPYPKTPAAIKRQLARQLEKPVLFDKQLQAMKNDGVTLFLEVGAGSTLTRLVQQNLGDSPCRAVSLDSKNETGLSSFWNAMGELSTLGISLNFEALWSSFEPELPDFSQRPLQPGEVMISGANCGKKYPPQNGSAGKTPAVIDSPQHNKTFSPSAENHSHSLSNNNMSTSRNHHPDTPQRLDALERIQQNMMKAHSDFQQALTQSHIEFLRASEQLIGQLKGQPLENATQIPIVQPVATPQPEVAAAPSRPPVFESPLPNPQSPAGNTNGNVPAAAPSATPTASRSQPASPPPDNPIPADVETLILSVVAESTGYPAETISMTMDLESELGIDSIKKVEIFAELEASFPQLADADPAQLGGLSTLEEIVAFIEKNYGGTVSKNS